MRRTVYFVRHSEQRIAILTPTGTWGSWGDAAEFATHDEAQQAAAKAGGQVVAVIPLRN